MKKERIHELLNNPASTGVKDIDQLQQVIKDYPYFSNAHLLLLFGLQKIGSDKYEEQLQQSALFLQSRKVLLKAVLHEWPVSPVTFNSVEEEINIEQSGQSFEIPNIASPAAENNIQETVPSIAEEINVEKTLAETLRNEEEFSFLLEDSQPIEILENKEEDIIQKPGNNTELLDFDISTAKVEKEDVSENAIDQFLKINPRIKPKLDLEDERGDISEPSTQDTGEFVSETLASIFEQQGLIEKAKDVYQKLILKYPEKSTYFASRIEELNNRSK